MPRSHLTLIVMVTLLAGCRNSSFGPAGSMFDRDPVETARSSPPNWKSDSMVDIDEMPAEAPQVRTPERLLESAHEAAAHNRLDEARQGYESVIAAQSGNYVAHHRLAVVADIQKDFRVAEQHYRLALAYAPEEPQLLSEMYSDLGYSYLLQSRFAESEANLKRSLEFNPEYSKALNNLGALYGTQGDYDRALTMFRSSGAPESDVQANLRQLFPNGPPTDSSASASQSRRSQPINQFASNRSEFVTPGASPSTLGSSRTDGLQTGNQQIWNGSELSGPVAQDRIPGDQGRVGIGVPTSTLQNSAGNPRPQSLAAAGDIAAPGLLREPPFTQTDSWPRTQSSPYLGEHQSIQQPVTPRPTQFAKSTSQAGTGYPGIRRTGPRDIASGEGVFQPGRVTDSQLRSSGSTRSLSSGDNTSQGLPDWSPNMIPERSIQQTQFQQISRQQPVNPDYGQGLDATKGPVAAVSLETSAMVAAMNAGGLFPMHAVNRQAAVSLHPGSGSRLGGQVPSPQRFWGSEQNASVTPNQYSPAAPGDFHGYPIESSRTQPTQVLPRSSPGATTQGQRNADAALLKFEEEVRRHNSVLQPPISEQPVQSLQTTGPNSHLYGRHNLRQPENISFPETNRPVPPQ